MYKSAAMVLCGLLLAAVGGCAGGGGGASGTSAPQPVTISSSNAKTIASAVLVSSLEGADLSTYTPTGAPTSTSPKPTAQLYSKIASVKAAETTSLMEQSQAGYMLAAVSGSTSCSAGGSVALSGGTASQTTLTIGDTVTLTFTDCNDGTALVNGELKMQVKSFSGDFVSGLYSLGVDVTVTNFSVTENGKTATANGDISLLADTTQSPSIHETITGNSLSVTAAGATDTLSKYSLMLVADTVGNTYSIDASGTLTSSAFDGSVSFTTQTKLVGTGTGYASSGDLLITGANGGTIHVVVLDGTNVRLEVDFNGDGQVDQVIDSTWADLT